MATLLKCRQCGAWNERASECGECSAPRQVHSTLANQRNPERYHAFKMPTMEWNRDPELPTWKRRAVNTGKALNWMVLTVGGALAWMAYWVAV